MIRYNCDCATRHFVSLTSTLDDSDGSFFFFPPKSRFLKIKKKNVHFQIICSFIFFSDLARKAIFFHSPQLSVVIVAAKLKLVLRHRVYTQSVCNFLSGDVSSSMWCFLNIAILYSSTTLLRMLSPKFRRLVCGFVWSEAFCGERYPEWRLLYRLWHSLLLGE